ADEGLTVVDTLRLAGSSTLTHSSALESGLQITAGRVVVEVGSAIDVTGRGYLGGNRSGFGETGATLGFQPGAQRGNGGSYGGLGGHYSSSGANQPNPVYGSLTDPVELGSGGGAWSGDGGNGGGRVLIMAGTIVNDGSIIADGGESSGSASGDGSGGSIHLATRVLSGTGSIRADGGGGGTNTGGGGGRIAIRYSEAFTLPLDNIQVRGGDGFYGDGQEGTVFFDPPVGP
ncbi:MAG: hypothetical protein HYY20_14500, partial [Candidatus Tectomicrobia bacterium]|nr:hypothetical protein [Candidatus Tectomicrobia bacterium]